MENKPRRRSRKPQAETTEVIAKVAAPVVDRQSELIDEKISQIISLQNGLNANERMLEELNVKIKDYSKQVMELKAENVKLRNSYTNLDYNCKNVYAQLVKVPKLIKWLYNIK
jgi:predicted RNase H-like nuclease (RuvC/YqgF family)